jgi:uncharacterized phage protein (TIGR02218 family)
VTSLNEAIDYDDGAGEVTYNALVGMDNFAFDKSAGLDVDNSEVLMLLADAGDFSAVAIDAGVLDYGRYVVYRVNWADLTMGHEIVDAGTIGITKNVDGVSAVIELRSLQQTLKQNYINLDSRTCRAKFGSGGGGTCVTRGQCGFDADSLWANRTVSAVGDESDREFTLNSPPSATGPAGALTFVPGLVQWLTGQNAGLTSEIESVDGSTITLILGTNFTIAVSDTLKIRPDCDKTWTTCKDVYENQLNFRGEPFIPVSDAASQSVPHLPNSGDFVLPDVI